MKKLLALAMALTLCLGLAACGGTPAEDPADENTPQTETSGETVTLRVGATPAPHQEILEQVVDTLAAQGITLEIVPYTDYLTPTLLWRKGRMTLTSSSTSLTWKPITQKTTPTW